MCVSYKHSSLLHYTKIVLLYRAQKYKKWFFWRIQNWLKIENYRLICNFSSVLYSGRWPAAYLIKLFGAIYAQYCRKSLRGNCNTDVNYTFKFYYSGQRWQCYITSFLYCLCFWQISQRVCPSQIFVGKARSLKLDTDTRWPVLKKHYWFIMYGIHSNLVFLFVQAGVFVQAKVFVPAKGL